MSTANVAERFLRDMADGVKKACEDKAQADAIIGLVLIGPNGKPEFWAPEEDARIIGDALMNMDVVRITGCTPK